MNFLVQQRLVDILKTKRRGAAVYRAAPRALDDLAHRLEHDGVYEPLLAGLAKVEDDLALEAASVYTANIGRWHDPEHYWPDPEDLLCYLQAAERTRKQVDRLTPPKRKKSYCGGPGKLYCAGQPHKVGMIPIIGPIGNN
jgi:hypothetical protein